MAGESDDTSTILVGLGIARPFDRGQQAGFQCVGESFDASRAEHAGMVPRHDVDLAPFLTDIDPTLTVGPEQQIEPLPDDLRPEDRNAPRIGPRAVSIERWRWVRSKRRPAAVGAAPSTPISSEMAATALADNASLSRRCSSRSAGAIALGQPIDDRWTAQSIVNGRVSVRPSEPTAEPFPPRIAEFEPFRRRPCRPVNVPPNNRDHGVARSAIDQHCAAPSRRSWRRGDATPSTPTGGSA